jgi:hypothetical protein
MKMVADNRALLDSLAHTLLENEVLEREDIERLVSEYRDGGGGGGGDTNGFRPKVVPVREPGKPSVAAAKPLDRQPGADSPS